MRTAGRQWFPEARTALALPERLGGDGVGLPEIGTALTEVGRHATVSPALATLGLGMLPILDLATEWQQDRCLDGVGKGVILTAALNEPGASLPDRPAVTLDGGRLNGVKVGVPYARQANWMLVSTRCGCRGGVSRRRRRASDRYPDLHRR